MFLRCTERFKAGKNHRYWNIVENKRTAGGHVVQRQVLYLREINDSQQEAWRRNIEVFEYGKPHPKTIALFPEDRPIPEEEIEAIQVKLNQLQIKRPRQWGGAAGYSVNFGSRYRWIVFGMIGFYQAERGPGGSTSSRPSPPID